MLSISHIDDLTGVTLDRACPLGKKYFSMQCKFKRSDCYFTYDFKLNSK